MFPSRRSTNRDRYGHGAIKSGPTPADRRPFGYVLTYRRCKGSLPELEVARAR
jgi:hypothetical protein